MQSIETYNFKNKKAIVRVDFNVPLNGKFDVTDDTRIKAAIPTLKKILTDGGAVIVMSHLGRPKNGPVTKFSLKHTMSTLAKLLNTDVDFAGDCIGEEAEYKAQNLSSGKILLLENLRFYEEEIAGDKEFASKLASYADVYVNDAFGTAHRAHASTTVIAQFFPNDKLFGYLIENELKSIDKALKEGEKPFTAIIGGAKVSSKINVITRMLDSVDNLIIGGGMAYTFAKAMGGKVGNSLVEDDKLEMANNIMKEAKEKGVSIHLPIDTIIADKFDNDANIKSSLTANIPDGWMGLDIGEQSINNFKEVITESKTILWNGPMGVFELSNFAKGTKDVALSIADATSKGAFSLIGGGDSVAAINKFNLNEKVSYISTGGGAMLEYLEGTELPGVAAIRN
jgi:phosphoglycerate kinase